MKTIFIIETKFLAPKFGGRKAGAFAYNLDKRRLNEVLNEYNIEIKKQVKGLSFEEVIGIINNLNKK